MNPTPIVGGMRSREPRLEWAGAALEALAFAVMSWLFRGFTTDDAWISLRYARHLAEGLGPVWNPGGPPVEGYSNPLLVAVEAAFIGLGGDGLALAKALGFAAGLGVIAAVARGGGAVVGSRPAALAAVGTGLWAPLAFWAMGGLETLPAALLVTGATLVLARGGSPLVAGCLLAPLAGLRPEALIVATALGMVSQGGALARGPRREALGRLTQIVGPAAAVAGALLLTRLAWFGAWVPNSVLYKGGTWDHGQVTIRFLRESAPLALAATVGAWTLRGRARLLAVPPLLYGLASVGFKDSVNEFSRFLLPMFPLLGLLAVVGLGSIWARSRVGGAMLTLALLGWQLRLSPANPNDVWIFADGYRDCKAAVRGKATDWLRAHGGAEERIGVADAGLLPYRLDREILDLFWLNSPELQRQGKRDSTTRAAWLMRDPPEWLVISTTRKGVANYATERAILQRAEFWERYALGKVFKVKRCNYRMAVYRRAGG